MTTKVGRMASQEVQPYGYRRYGRGPPLRSAADNEHIAVDYPGPVDLLGEVRLAAVHVPMRGHDQDAVPHQEHRCSRGPGDYPPVALPHPVGDPVGNAGHHDPLMEATLDASRSRDVHHPHVDVPQEGDTLPVQRYAGPVDVDHAPSAEDLQDVPHGTLSDPHDIGQFGAAHAPFRVQDVQHVEHMGVPEPAGGARIHGIDELHIGRLPRMIVLPKQNDKYVPYIVPPRCSSSAGRRSRRRHPIRRGNPPRTPRG